MNDEPQTGPTHKACTKCLKHLPLSDFANRKDTIDGKRSRCKRCSNQKNVEYWNSLDPKERQRRLVKYNQTEGRKRAKKKWRENNRDAAIMYAHNRRVQFENVTKEEFTVQEIFVRDKGICHLCKKDIDLAFPRFHPLSLTIDHIIPISRGGDHTRANVKVAHWSCNCSKGNRLMEELEL